MSAVSNVFASLGFGSNVCELVPSGTMPVTSVPVPPAMLATMLVIGATVVAMVSTPVTGHPARIQLKQLDCWWCAARSEKTNNAIATMDLRIEFMFSLYVSAP